MTIIKRISNSPLLRGSVLFFVANNAVSFGNFLYNLFMGRLLTPSDYGDLGALVSILVLFGVPFAYIQILVVKTISTFWGHHSKGAILSFFNQYTPVFLKIGLLAGVLVILLSNNLNLFIHLDDPYPMLIIALSIVFSFNLIFNKSILQGMLSFVYLTLNSFVEIALKVIISIILVVLNFGLMGALIGPAVGGAANYLLSALELKFLLRRTDSKEISPLPKLRFFQLRTSIPVLMMTLTLTVFFTADVILVRHLFPADIAGEYVALSTIGRISFYAVGPVISVMFPLITSRVSGGLPYILPLLGTLVISMVISVAFIFLNFLFPGLLVGIIYGNKYTAIVPYLGLTFFYISVYTINSILTYFLFSVSYYKPIYILFSFSLLPSVFIFLFHKSLFEIIWINIITSVIFLIVASAFVIHKEKDEFVKIILKSFPKGIYVR